MEPDTHAAFIAFLRSNRRSASATTRCVDHVIAFEEWLGRPLPDATISDLDRFVAEQDPPTLAKTRLWALAYYFDFVEIEELAEQSRRLRASLVRPRPLSLSTLVGVDPAVVSALAELGIASVDGLVDATQTLCDRLQLATTASSDLATIDDIRQMSRLSAIRGVRGIRARLYRDTVGSVEGLAATTSEQLITLTAEHIAAGGQAGVPPTPTEAAFTIDAAQRLAAATPEPSS